MGNVVLIGSQKDCIGKTIIGIKIGIILSEKGKRVLLMDLSSGKKKISEYLNVNEDIIYDVKDALDSICSLEQAAIEINERLSLLPCPRIADKLGDITLEAFSKLTSEAENSYDIIIADVDKISSSYIDFNLINSIITINSNDFSCIKEVNQDKYISQKFNIESFYAMINRYDKKDAKRGKALNVKDIHKMTEVDIDVVIEENIRYLNIDHNFLSGTEENSFNKAVRTISEKLT